MLTGDVDKLAARLFPVDRSVLDAGGVGSVRCDDRITGLFCYPPQHRRVLLGQCCREHWRGSEWQHRIGQATTRRNLRATLDLTFCHRGRRTSDHHRRELIPRPNSKSLAHNMRRCRLPKDRRHAKAARIRDCEVVQTVVEPEPTPLLSDQGCGHLGSLTGSHRAHGTRSKQRDMTD